MRVDEECRKAGRSGVENGIVVDLNVDRDRQELEIHSSGMQFVLLGLAIERGVELRLHDQERIQETFDLLRASGFRLRNRTDE